MTIGGGVAKVGFAPPRHMRNERSGIPSRAGTSFGIPASKRRMPAAKVDAASLCPPVLYLVKRKRGPKSLTEVREFWKSGYLQRSLAGR